MAVIRTSTSRNMSARNKTEKKRRGLGGLSPEKRKLLKQLIVQKAADDLRKQKELEAAEKHKIVESRVPKLEISGLPTEELRLRIQELYSNVCELEEEKYDWELKIRKQDVEINELSAQANNIKGHFVKPVLKKVSKAEQQLAKFDSEKIKSKLSFLTTLKSTGQQKYAVEDKDNVAVRNPWRQQTPPGKDSDASVDEDKHIKSETSKSKSKKLSGAAATTTEQAATDADGGSDEDKEVVNSDVGSDKANDDDDAEVSHHSDDDDDDDNDTGGGVGKQEDGD